MQVEWLLTACLCGADEAWHSFKMFFLDICVFCSSAPAAQRVPEGGLRCHANVHFLRQRWQTGEQGPHSTLHRQWTHHPSTHMWRQLPHNIIFSLREGGGQENELGFEISPTTCILRRYWLQPEPWHWNTDWWGGTKPQTRTCAFAHNHGAVMHLEGTNKIIWIMVYMCAE